MISPRYIFRFPYNASGRGLLSLWEFVDGVQVERLRWPARSGSITKDGVLVNCIEAGTLYLCKAPEIPVKDEYLKMWIKELPGFGWKWRLFELVNGVFVPLSLLFHPDGNIPGTNGCVSPTMGNAVDLFTFGMNHMNTDGSYIPVEVVNA